jgi:hypothetical protein
MGEGPTNGSSSGRTPIPWLAIIAGIVVASPVLEAVRRATEPSAGEWGAFGLGVLAASAVGLLVLSLANWIIRRERRGRPDDPAVMVYRPAIFPVWVFAGALLKNLPSALTEWLPYVYTGWLAVLLGGAFALQWRRGLAWSWWVAVPVGVGIALAGLAGAVWVTHAITGVRPT